MSWVHETFASFAVPHYRLLWTGSMFATTAFMMSFILIPAVPTTSPAPTRRRGSRRWGSGIGMLLVARSGA